MGWWSDLKKKFKKNRSEAPKRNTEASSSRGASAYRQRVSNRSETSAPVKRESRITFNNEGRGSAVKRTRNTSGGSAEIQKRSKIQQEKDMERSGRVRAMAGFAENLMPINPHGEYKNKALTKTKEYKAGAIAGTVAGYAAGYGAVGKATGKAGAKIAASAVGKKTASKIAGTKVARNLAKMELKKAGKEITEDAIKKTANKQASKIVKVAGKDLVADATIGTALDASHAKSSGVENKKDFAKYMGENALLNLGIGGAMDVAAPALKGLKAGKKLAKADLEGAGRLNIGLGKNTVKRASKEGASETVESAARQQARERADEALKDKDFADALIGN